MSALNLPMFSRTPEQKHVLKLLAAAYQKCEEPGANKIGFEYIERTGNEVVYASVGSNMTVLLMGIAVLSNKELIIARDMIRKKIEVDEQMFFINKY